jgi:hypothetical protein
MRFLSNCGILLTQSDYLLSCYAVFESKRTIIYVFIKCRFLSDSDGMSLTYF